MAKEKDDLRNLPLSQPIVGQRQPARLVNRPAGCQFAWFLCIATLALILPTGCAQQRSQPDQPCLGSHARVSASMILAPSQGCAVDPQLFSYRSLWPATLGQTHLGETTIYRELWHDRQSLWPNRSDHSYKLFRSYRMGIHTNH